MVYFFLGAASAFFLGEAFAVAAFFG